MRVKLIKHGSSLRLKLSAAEDRTLTLRPACRRYSVTELLEGVPNKGLLYEDVPDFPVPLGKEAEWL